MDLVRATVPTPRIAAAGVLLTPRLLGPSDDLYGGKPTSFLFSITKDCKLPYHGRVKGPKQAGDPDDMPAPDALGMGFRGGKASGGGSRYAGSRAGGTEAGSVFGESEYGGGDDNESEFGAYVQRPSSCVTACS